MLLEKNLAKVTAQKVKEKKATEKNTGAEVCQSLVRTQVQRVTTEGPTAGLAPSGRVQDVRVLPTLTPSPESLWL